MIILAILNLGINLKGFSENALVDGVILVGDVAYSVWITAFVLVIWMFLSSNSQVRADVKLGRVQKGRKLSLWVLLVLLLATPFIAAALLYLFAIIFAISTFSIISSTLIIMIEAMILGALGRYIGISWGRNK